MKKPITIGVDQRGHTFALPLDLATQTVAILARKRVGKTYTASVMAEEFAAAQLPFVVLDPTGAWWGLRSSDDGKREGYPVVIIGGAHGDVALEPTAGKVIAELVVEHPGFYIIDLSQTASNAEQDRFATDFAERLYRIKEKHRFPLHLFVDEADSFAPQKPFPGQQRMLGAFEAIVRRGGIRGLGATMITQRPAVLNKSVLTQCEVLVVLQMTGPQDQDAIEDWVKRNGTKEERDTMMASLASLQRGEAWVWSPSWLQCFEKIAVRLRRTFNSSATPAVGEAKLEPTKLAPVDIEKLGADIAATVERARENDPKELKKQIAFLERKIAEKAVAEPKLVEVPVVSEEQTSMIRYGIVEIGLLRNQIEKFVPAVEKLWKEFHTLTGNISQADRSQAPRPSPRRTASVIAPNETAQPRTEKGHLYDKLVINTPSAPSEVGAGGMRRMMVAMAQRPGLTRRQLGVRAGMSSTSGTFNTYLAKLRTNGWINEVGGQFVLTSGGESALGAYNPLPEGRYLLQYWLNELGEGGAGRILMALAEAYPKPLSREELGHRSGMSASSGTFNTYLSRLRTLELVTGKSELRATEEFFS